MSDELVGYSEAEHPGPHRERVGLTALFYGLFVAPIAWAGNLMTTYALATHACYPGSEPLEHAIAGFEFVWPLNLALFVATLLLCASGFAVSFRNWRLTGSEAEGHAHRLMEAGEGRTRYLGIIGMSFSVLFFSATLAGIIIMGIVPLCLR